jgi:hypothetical protein
MDCRLESLEVLNKTLGGLKDYTEPAGAESFDSVGDEDDAETDYETEDSEIERGYNLSTPDHPQSIGGSRF